MLDYHSRSHTDDWSQTKTRAATVPATDPAAVTMAQRAVYRGHSGRPRLRVVGGTRRRVPRTGQALEPDVASHDVRRRRSRDDCGRRRRSGARVQRPNQDRRCLHAERVDGHHGRPSQDHCPVNAPGRPIDGPAPAGPPQRVPEPGCTPPRAHVLFVERHDVERHDVGQRAAMAPSTARGHARGTTRPHRPRRPRGTSPSFGRTSIRRNTVTATTTGRAVITGGSPMTATSTRRPTGTSNTHNEAQGADK